MDVTIREARICDTPEIQKLNEKLNGLGLSTIESMNESLENNKNELVFVALHGNKIIGFICGQLYSSICYSNSLQCEITELIVDENYRRNGIGTILMERMELEFTKNNVHEIVLLTGINNINAQKLYEKRGYVYKRKAYIKNTQICTE